MWKYIEDWKRCFQNFDADGSGSIDRNELQNALRTFGYNITDNITAMLIQKFDKYGKPNVCPSAKTDADKGRVGQPGRGDVTFDNFVQACVTIKTLTDSFRNYDRDGDGYIQIGYEQVKLLRVHMAAANQFFFPSSWNWSFASDEHEKKGVGVVTAAVKKTIKDEANPQRIILIKNLKKNECSHDACQVIYLAMARIAWNL